MRERIIRSGCGDREYASANVNLSGRQLVFFSRADLRESAKPSLKGSENEMTQSIRHKAVFAGRAVSAVQQTRSAAESRVPCSAGISADSPDGAGSAGPGARHSNEWTDWNRKKDGCPCSGLHCLPFHAGRLPGSTPHPPGFPGTRSRPTARKAMQRQKRTHSAGRTEFSFSLPVPCRHDPASVSNPFASEAPQDYILAI